MSDISDHHHSQSLLQPRLVHTIADRFSTTNTYLICEPRVVVVNPRSVLNVHLLYNYMKNILHRPMSDIDLIVLTFLHSDYATAIEALHHVCTAPIAASNRLQQRYEQRDIRGIPIDLWLENDMLLPYHPDWRSILYPDEASESLFLHNTSTQELISGDTITVFEGNPFLRYDLDMGRKELEDLLVLARSLDVCYLYPIRGRQLLRVSPFAHVSL